MSRRPNSVLWGLYGPEANLALLHWELMSKPEQREEIENSGYFQEIEKDWKEIENNEKNEKIKYWLKIEKEPRFINT